MKTCTKCKCEKDLSEFNKNKSEKDGLQKWCKSCRTEYNYSKRDYQSEYQKRYRDFNVLELRDYRLKKIYGISLDDYNEILAKQGDGCAICGTSLNHSGHVDHCHTTGMVRGVLCSQCNTAIGKFKDDIELLDNAIAYLTYHNSRGAEWQKQTSNR
jgi:Recombination endonuclease VII